MMHVQDYAGSGIKSGSCWKCCSGFRLRYSYNSRPIFQLTQSIARVFQQ